MGFLDLIKKSVVAEFTGTIPTGDLILSLVIAFIAALFIAYIYKKTFSGVGYIKTEILTFVLLAMVTSLVIRTINSNLALSLGMVGALSIVRFRTAVKDPVDTGFMFWAITAGIMSGAGLYFITLIASLVLGVLYLLFNTVAFKPTLKYLLVVNVNEKNTKEILDFILPRKKTILKTESLKADNVELTFELSGSDITGLVSTMKEKPGVSSVHLVNID